MDWQIEGHRNQLQLLEKALNAGKLAHAYVFAGPFGSGKKKIAKKLANALLEVTPPAASQHPPLEGEGKIVEDKFHPDLLMIKSDDGIKIDQIRELVYKLSLKPYQAKNKVAIIDRAEEMTVEASNALLKSLEEPKGYTYIFLITTNPNRLPKTILSRCQKITFGPVKSEVAETEEIATSKSFLETFLHGTLADKLVTAYDIADLETDEIKKMFDYWLTRLEELLSTQASKSLARKTSQVLSARKLLDQNANSKLLLTNLMLNT